MALIEREDALLRVMRFLDQLRSQRRGVLRIAGDPGSGRTRVLSEVVSAAKLRNFHVIHLRGSARAKLRPYGAWLEGSPSTLPLPERGPDSLAAALASSCEHGALAGVLIAADDLPEFDFSSYELLSQLLSESPVRCLAVAYTTNRASARSYLEIPACVHDLVELSPLSRDGTVAWLRNAFRWEAPPAFVDWLHERTRGAPGALSQTVLQLREQGLLRRLSAHDWMLDPIYATAALPNKLRQSSLTPTSFASLDLTDVVGRDHEETGINSLLDRSRLVSIVGPCGVGKTRLALQVARARSGDFPDGTHLVALSGISTELGLIGAIATSLGVGESEGRTLRDVIAHSLVEKETLLVLDGFDGVARHAQVVTDLVAMAPLVRVLLTCREALRISGEHVFRLSALGALDPSVAGDKTRSPATALFLLRSQYAVYGTASGDRGSLAIGELCRRVHGLPLAIELVAGQMGDRTPEEAVASVAQTWAPLRDPEEIIKAVLHWSFGSLGADEQAIFARLSVFSGGFSSEAAEAIANLGDLDGKVGMLISSLLHRRLLTPGDGGVECRYLMSEVVRRFALQRLDVRGETKRLRDRHVDFFGGVAAEFAPRITGSRQRLILEHLDREQENFRAASAWAQTTDGLHAEAVKLATALAPFWERRGRFTEGEACLEALIAWPDNELEVATRAVLMLLLARFARLRGNLMVAKRRLVATQPIVERAGDRSLLGRYLLELGQLELAGGSTATAAEGTLRLSLDLFREIQDESRTAETACVLGFAVLARGDHSAAETLARDGLRLARKLGESSLSTRLVNLTAKVARAQNDFPTAAAYFEECRSACEWLDDKRGMVDALLGLTELARAMNDQQKARAGLRHLVALCRDLGDTVTLAQSVRDLGDLARFEGDYLQATELYDRCLRLYEVSGQASGMGDLRRCQAEVFVHEGERERARELFRESLERSVEEPRTIVLCCAGVAHLANVDGHAERAAQLIAAAEPVFADHAAGLSSEERALFEQRRSIILRSVDSAVVEAARRAVAALSLGDLVDLAIEQATEGL